MKAIILISSIFYILGLKLGNKIDLVKKAPAVKKVITIKKEDAKKSDQNFDFKENLNVKPDNDSINGGSSYSDALLKEVK